MLFVPRRHPVPFTLDNPELRAGAFDHRLFQGSYQFAAGEPSNGIRCDAIISGVGMSTIGRAILRR
jgi:hypothetical protein